MCSSKELVPFPLYHGSSSLFLSSFKPGTTPAPWPYKRAALCLLNDVWADLSQRGGQLPAEIRDDLLWDITYEEMPFYVRNIIDQVSRHSNWQHGELYLTPSKLKAVEYARGGARYGGELVTMCKDALDSLTRVDPERAKQLIGRVPDLSTLLSGTDCPPILVEFVDVRLTDLSTETQGGDVLEELCSLTDKKLLEALGSEERVREIVGQQTNFRLTEGCGVVHRVFQVLGKDQDNPSSPFVLKEICSSGQWAH